MLRKPFSLTGRLCTDEFRKDHVHSGFDLGAPNGVAERQKTDLIYTSIPALLHHEDRNSMTHSVESRLPFLDYELVEFAVNCRVSLKLRDGWSKWILRSALAGILPEKIRLRKTKLGFDVPDGAWVRSGLQNGHRELWESPKLRMKRYLDEKSFTRECRNFLRGVPSSLPSPAIFRAISLEMARKIAGLKHFSSINSNNYFLRTIEETDSYGIVELDQRFFRGRKHHHSSGSPGCPEATSCEISDTHSILPTRNRRSAHAPAIRGHGIETNGTRSGSSNRVPELSARQVFPRVRTRVLSPGAPRRHNHTSCLALCGDRRRSSPHVELFILQCHGIPGPAQGETPRLYFRGVAADFSQLPGLLSRTFMGCAVHLQRIGYVA
jgi:hypothetical protein